MEKKMSKKKNGFFRSNDEALLKRVEEDYLYLGRDVVRTGPDELTIYARPRNTAKKKAEEEKAAQRLSKREREEGIVPR
jgi:hypothetical protein